MKIKKIIPLIFLVLLFIFFLKEKPVKNISDLDNKRNDIACLDSIKLSEAIYKELNSGFIRDSDDKRATENREFIFCNLTPFDLEPTIRNLSNLGKKSKLISPRDIEIDKFYIWIISIDIYGDEIYVRMVANSEITIREKVEPYIYGTFLFFNNDLFYPDCEWDKDTYLTYPDSMRLDLLLNEFLDISYGKWTMWSLFENKEVLLICNESNVYLDKAVDNLSNFRKPNISVLKEECDRDSSSFAIFIVIKDNIAYVSLGYSNGGAYAILVFKNNQWEVLASTYWVF